MGVLVHACGTPGCGWTHQGEDHPAKCANCGEGMCASHYGVFDVGTLPKVAPPVLTPKAK
jgi:hypothetical protein